MYKLIVSDLDGTLLNAEHRLGTYTRSVLQALAQRGYEIVLASGRHFQDIRSLASLLDSQSYLISSNGAAVHDHRGATVSCTAIHPDCLDFLLRGPCLQDVHVNLYRTSDWLTQEHKPELLRFHRDSGFAYRLVDFRNLSAAPVLKVFYYAESIAVLEALKARILERHGDRVTTTFSLPEVLEVMASGVSKGTALLSILDMLDIEATDVIAFGDGLNDLEMLHAAGKGVLMGNAAPALKAACRGMEVIGSHAEEAVARYLAPLLEHRRPKG